MATAWRVLWGAFGDAGLHRLDWTQPEPEVVRRIEHWRSVVYNTLRPHEAVGNMVPAARWYKSERPRPAQLPEVYYPAKVQTRKVMQKGEISWRGYELMVGSGLTGEYVGVTEEGGEVVLWYGPRQLRRVPADRLVKGRTV